MKFKTIYVDAIDSIKKTNNTNSQDEFLFMEFSKIEHVLKQLRMFCDHISYSLFHDINDHPQVTQIFNLTKELGFRFDVEISSMKFIDHIDENLENNAISSVSLCLSSLEENKSFDSDESVQLLANAIEKLTENGIHVVVDLPSKNPERYKKSTLDFINTLGLDLNNKLWQKGFQVNVSQYLMIRCCELLESTGELPAKTIGRCYGSVTMLAVLSNGNVIPCNHLLGKQIIMGNIFEETLSEILSREPYISISDGFYKNELVHPICQHCPRPRKNF